jgi:rare lipoprotein A
MNLGKTLMGRKTLIGLSLIGVVGLFAQGASATRTASNPETAALSEITLARPAADPRRAAGVRRLAVVSKPTLDRTGRECVGKASFYAKMFAGRTMADGTLMRPSGDNAASRTLPLGTTAKVTNLETGKIAVVTIRDRGPYVAGRIVDLSPATARQIGLSPTAGVATVAVEPITLPES